MKQSKSIVSLILAMLIGFILMAQSLHSIDLQTDHDIEHSNSEKHHHTDEECSTCKFQFSHTLNYPTFQISLLNNPLIKKRYLNTPITFNKNFFRFFSLRAPPALS